MTNFEMLADAFSCGQSEENLESISTYIDCPNVELCLFDGNDNSICVNCKINWLQAEAD